MDEKLFIRCLAHGWLQRNPERLNAKEKAKFQEGLEEFLLGESKTIDDEVYDFLVQTKAIHKDPRHITFLEYLKRKYPKISAKKILDVGAGRCCHLSSSLAECGYKPYAMDPSIRLDSKEIKALGIVNYFKSEFRCDEFAKNGKGTNIMQYDAMAGLEPCLATEHIIRQGIKYNKPFDILLCYENHDSLNGDKFKSPEDWFDYLMDISGDIHVEKHGKNFIATNYEYDSAKSI